MASIPDPGASALAFPDLDALVDRMFQIAGYLVDRPLPLTQLLQRAGGAGHDGNLHLRGSHAGVLDVDEPLIAVGVAREFWQALELGLASGTFLIDADVPWREAAVITALHGLPACTRKRPEGLHVVNVRLVSDFVDRANADDDTRQRIVCDLARYTTSWANRPSTVLKRVERRTLP